MILFICSYTQPDREGARTSRVITDAVDREHAKNIARPWLGGNPDNYVVTPLTKHGDRIKIDIALTP